MKIRTIVLATAFALSSSLAFAQSGNDAGAAAPEHSATTTKHSAKHYHRRHHMARRSGPGLEPGAPDASRPGGKGVSNRPGD
jgi:hypothetical protein